MATRYPGSTRTHVLTGQVAAELEGGAAAVPTADNIAAVVDRYTSMMAWRVQNAALAGDRVNACTV